MSTNPFADDPTIHAEYFDGRWINRGATFTTRDVHSIHERLATNVERIQSQRSLSDHAKRVQIARAYKDARDSITAIGQQQIDAVNAQRKTLARKLFGHDGNADPTTVAIRRDAADRAASMTDPAVAERALQRAERDGDIHMAQAIAAHANDMLWGGVLDLYATMRPEAADLVTSIQELPDTTDATYLFQHAMTYGIAQPAELGSIPDYKVDQLAADSLDGDAPTAA